MNKKVESKLTSVGLKVTEARCAILDILISYKSPQNYEQIKSKMSMKMDKATFYRNMQAFEKKGLINKFESKKRVWHYELGKANHAHFMCGDCEEILCLDLEIPKSLIKCEISSIAIKGRCENCIKKEST